MINQSTIIIAIFLTIVTFVIPRKYFMVPFIVCACFIPADQRVIIFDLDFTPLRILVAVGMFRLWIRGEITKIRWNKFDKIILLWASVGAVIYVLQWQDLRSLIYKCGVLFDILGLYWLFRQNTRSWADIHFMFAAFALCALIMLPLVLLEWTTGKNLFSILGEVGTEVRPSGSYRCQASFPHSIIMGLFWANLVPIFFVLGVTNRSSKSFYWLACAANVLMVIATNSSTPIVTLMTITLLLILYRYRSYGRQIAYILFGIAVILHLVMKAPVWHLPSRMNVVGGSTGYHRYKLIDNAIEYFHEWALLGTRSTVHWGWAQKDITNQYIFEAVTGGLITLLIFLVLMFQAVTIMSNYSMHGATLNQRWLCWGICVSILGHCISFLGVSYFGQIRMLLFLTFSVVGFVCGMRNTKHQLFQSKVSFVDA